MASHSLGHALAKLDAPRQPEDLESSVCPEPPEPDPWDPDDVENEEAEYSYYANFYGLGFPEMDSIRSTTKVQFPTNGRIKRFLKQSIAKEIMQEFLRSHGFSSDGMEMQRWSHTFLPSERLGPLHLAAKEGETEVLCAMLRQKADIHQKTSRGRTAVDLALAADCCGSHRQIIRILSEVRFGNARSLHSLSSIPTSGGSSGCPRTTSMPKSQSVVLVCHDGRGSSAAAAVAWLTLRCGQTLDSSINAVVESARQVGASRGPLEAFENREAFCAALSKVSRPATVDVETRDFEVLEVPDASEIIDGLFVGTAEAGIEATVGANSRQIRYILNVGGCVTPAIFAAVAEALAENGDEDGRGTKTLAIHDQVYTQNGVVTLAIPMDDFGRTQLTETFLQRCFDFIAAGLEDGRVLVHCRLGVNRSVTVAAAFLMRRKGFSAEQALQLLRERRPGAQPNEAYCEQLRQMPQVADAEYDTSALAPSPS
eukprot:s1287_g4.t1